MTWGWGIVIASMFFSAGTIFGAAWNGLCRKNKFFEEGMKSERERQMQKPEV